MVGRQEVEMAETIERSKHYENRVPEGGELAALRRLVEAGMAPSAAHAVLLGFEPAGNAAEWLVDHISNGLPYGSASRLQAQAGLSQRQLATLLHTSARTLERRRHAGSLDPEESDRAATLSRVLAGALALFEYDRDAAVGWLSGPRRALGGRSAWEMAQTEAGAREVEALIGRLEHGVFT